MTTFVYLIKNFAREESGQDLIEYALIAAIIALGSVLAMGTLANNISSAFSGIGSTLAASIP